nr:poly(U)-specific endoribonuclease homolog [Danaus plexippus plexippus]
MKLFTLFIFVLQISLGFNKVQRYNPSSDFLLHEAGVPAPDFKNNYASQFPSLPSAKPSVPTSPTNNLVTTAKPQQTGKRDYVATQISTKNPATAVTTPKTQLSTAVTPNPSRRDYVAPQFPTAKPLTTQKQYSNSPTVVTQKTPSPKRDYVAPNLPKDNRQTPGKVKDLINFYDSKSQGVSTPTRSPSYSSVLGGKGTQSTILTNPTPKPMSFSSVVSGPKKPSTGPSSSSTLTPTSPSKPAPTNLPTNVVLPSSLSNNQGPNSNSLTDVELQNVSEELLRKDVNNAAKYITISYQEKTTSMSKDDKSPLPLLTITPDAWKISTIEKFIPLLDNYERDTLVNEYVTPQERNEENAFMDAIMTTSVIRHLMTFLKDKGYVSPDPKLQRDFLKQIWFGLYSRGKGKISSSGFEHIFVSELKNGEVSGLHNWIYFSREEVANRVNYLGYLKNLQLSDKGAIIKMHFNQQGVDKPVDTMFIGTSPELEMALYTLCYVTRVDKDCNLKLGTKDVNIVTHNYRYRSKNYIGSAYPQI